MKKSRFLLILYILVFSYAPSFSQSINKALNNITSEKASKHINYLASDALLGRKTPSAGLDSAANYIAAEFKKYNLKPVNGSYFQPVPLVKTILGDTNYVIITSNGIAKDLKIKSEFVPYEISSNSEANGQVVFAGYGITAPEYHYDDYKNIDVKDKIVLIFRHEPYENTDTSVFMGKKDTRHSYLSNKVINAIKHGAIGMLVITDPLNHQLLAPRGYAWPSLSTLIPKDAVPITLQENEQKIPVVHVGKEVMEFFFNSIDSLKKIQSALDANLIKTNDVVLSNASANIRTSVMDSAVKANNVVGYLEGSDPVLKKELIIIGGHYDHIGKKANYKNGEDYIYNGADDNASGTTGVLTVAEAFSKMKIKPKRSILFITFTAEEIGLYGSKAYVQNPLFPLDKTTAMLNMDMIGRNHPDTLFLEGARMSPDLTQIVQNENKGLGFSLILKDEAYLGSSDHANFYYKKIPFVFFFSGLHADYHSVLDNPDKIDLTKLVKVSKLVFKTAWYIANDNKYYKIVEKD
jgi:hypothetical protein